MLVAVLAVAVAALLTLTACGGGEPEVDGDPSSAGQVQEADPETAPNFPYSPQR